MPAPNMDSPLTVTRKVLPGRGASLALRCTSSSLRSSAATGEPAGTLLANSGSDNSLS